MKLYIRIYVFLWAGIFQAFAQNGDNSKMSTTNKNTEYAYFQSVYKEKDRWMVKADYVQYLTGKAALQAAKAAGDADTTYDDSGKMHIEIPNDFYIVNQNPKIRTLMVSKSCVYRPKEIENGLPVHQEKNISLLKEQFTDRVFKISLNNKNQITVIEEVYQP